MRLSHVCIPLFAALIACGAPAEPPAIAVDSPRRSAVAIVPQPTAETEVAPAEPPPAPYVDLLDAPGDPRLGAAAARFKTGEVRGAQAAIHAVLPEMERDGALYSMMVARALLGRASLMLGDPAGASRYFHAVIDERDNAVRATWGRLSRPAANALGEALFFVAEEKRAAAEKLRMPVYKGPHSADGITHHIDEVVAKWIEARTDAEDLAVNDYVQIAGEAEAPARWVVDGAARVALMRAKLTAEIRAAPLPRAWIGTGPIDGAIGVNKEDLRAFYYRSVDAVAEPLREQARTEYENCQRLSRKLGWVDEHTKQCDTWLENVPPRPPAAR